MIIHTPTRRRQLKSRPNLAAIMRGMADLRRPTWRLYRHQTFPGETISLASARSSSTSAEPGTLVLDKMPSAQSRARYNMNIRELWLYEKIFRNRRFDFVPEFYGSRVEGAAMQWVFGFIEGAASRLRGASARAGILRSLGALNALRLPGELPHERTSMPYMSPRKIGGRAGDLAAASDVLLGPRALADFRAALPAHAARYDRMKRGLAHGDLHRSNILLGADRKCT